MPVGEDSMRDFRVTGGGDGAGGVCGEHEGIGGRYCVVHGRGGYQGAGDGKGWGGKDRERRGWVEDHEAVCACGNAD